jgi:hypothetical protein
VPKFQQGQIIIYDALTLKPVSHCRQQGNQQQVKIEDFVGSI